MSKYGGGGGQNQIQFDVDFNVNKTSLKDVVKTLQEISNLNMKSGIVDTTDAIQKAKNTASQLLSILQKSFNVKLDSLNVEKFNSNLQASGLTIQKIAKELQGIGPAGQRAFNQFSSAVLTSNLQLKQTNGLINQMGTTMMNTVKWGIASSIFNNITQSVSQAFDYVKALDSALTDIRIVTGDSRDQMAKFAEEANRAAQSLGRSTMEYSKAALTFYQQGLNDQDVQARTEATLKAQNITGAGSQMADYLTAVWNGYKVANEEAELYVDKLAAVADSSASNMSQLAVAMSKVASTANMLGVPIDSLNAQIATIVATTRQAPESVGNALKTIYARINDIATGADGAEISLGNYSEKMMQVGISVLDTNGNLRDTGDVIEQIGGKWQTLSREQQIYLARTMAGQRQYNNLLALFENWGKYTDLVNVSMESQGTTMEKNSRYMESLEAHLNQLGAASERVKTAMVDSDSFKGLVDIGTNITNIFANFIEAIGGGGNALLMLGSIATRVFGNIIAKEITNVITNMQIARSNARQLQSDIDLTKAFIAVGQHDPFPQTTRELLELKQAAQSFYGSVSTEQVNVYQNILKEFGKYREQEQHYNNMVSLARELDAVNSKNKGAGGFDLFGEKGQGSFTTFQNSVQDAINHMKQLQQQGKATEGSLNTFYTGLSTSFAKNFKDETLGMFSSTYDSFSKLDQEYAKGKIQLNEYKRVLESFFQEIANANPENLKKLQALWLENKNAADNAKKAAEQYTKEMQRAANVKNFVQFIGAIGGLVSSLQMIVNLTKIWNNENLSTGEKVLQLMMSFTTIVTLVTRSLMTMRTVTLEQIKQLKNEKLITLEKQKQALLNKAGRAKPGKAAERDAIQAEIDALKGSGNGLKGNFDLLKGQASQLGTAISGAMAKTAFSINGVAVSVGALAASIAGIALVVGLTTYAIVKAWNSAKDAAEKATERAQQAKKVYNDTKSALTNLNSSWNSLQSAQDNLKNLAQGTDEWKSALQGVNDQVLQLIQKFPQLQQYLTTTADGMLTFRDGAKEAVTQVYQQRAQATGYAYIAAEQKRNEASNNYLIQDTARETGLADSLGFDNRTLTELMDAVHQHGEYILGDKDALQKLTNLNDKQIAKVINNTDKLAILAGKLEANTTATENLTESVTKSNLEGVTEYEESSNQDVFAALVNQKMTSGQLDDKYTTTKYVQGHTYEVENEKQLIKRYAEMQGLAEDQVKISGLVNRTLKVKNEQGKWQTVYDMQNLKNAIAAADAMENANLTYKEIADKMKTFEETFSGDTLNAAYQVLKAGDDLTKISSGSMSQKSIQELQTNVEQLSDLTGIGSEELSQALDQLYTDAGTNFQHFTENLSPLLKQAFKELDINSEDYSTEAAAAIASMLRKGVEKGGSEGYDLIKEIIGQLDPSDVTAFQNLLNSIDFSNIDLDTFNEYLDQAGIELENANPLLQQMINILKEAQTINPEEFYKNIHDITDKLKTGDLIDPEQASKLAESGINLSAFFDKMADGSYKLRADAEEFANYIHDFSIQPFVDEVAAARAKQNQFQAMEAQGADITRNAITDIDFKGLHQVDIGYDEALLDAQIEALDLIGAKTSQINQIQVQRQQGLKLTGDQLQLVYDAVESHKEQLQDLDGLWDAENEKIKQYQQQMATSVTNFDQLQELVDMGVLTEDDAAYSKGQDAAIEAAAERADVTKEAYEAYADGLKEAMLANEEFVGTAEDAEKASLKMAQQMYQLNEGLQDLRDNWEDYSEIIESGAESTPQYAEAIGALTASIEQMFGVPVSSDFVSQHLQQIGALAQGDISVIDQLAQAATQDYIMHISAEVDDAQAQADFAFLQSEIAQMELDDIQIGASIDDGPFIQKLNEMLAASQITEEQANNILKGIGYTPEITYKQVPMESVSDNTATGENEVQTVMEFPVFDGTAVNMYPVTMHQHSATTTAGGAAQNGMVSVPQINASGTKYTGASSGAGINGGLTRPPKTSGGGKGSCFIAGTLITTNQGFKKIENIQVGDIVLSYNQKLHQNEYSKVLQTMIHDVNEQIYTLYIGFRKLKVTGIHRFLITRNNQQLWIQTSKLQKGDKVLYANGTWHKIWKIKSKLQTIKVYNFEVSDNHNYYVGKNQILAHNKGGGGGGKSKQPSTGQKVKLTKPTEQKERVKNPYEQVEKSYQRQEKQLKNLENIEKKITGKDRLDNLRKQQKVLQQQLRTIKERERISTSGEEGSTAWYANLISKDLALNNNGKDKNLFDSDGQIANRDQLEKRATDAYNNAIKKANTELNAVEQAYNDWIEDTYNHMTAEQQQAAKEGEEKVWKAKIDAAKDAQKESIDLAKKEYDKRIGYLKDYESALQQDKKYHEQYLEYLEQLIDNAIEKTTIKLKFSIDTGDAYRDYLEFENKVIKKIDKDDIMGNFTARFKEITSFIDSGEIKEASKAVENLQNQIAQIQNNGFVPGLIKNEKGQDVTEEEWNKLSKEQREYFKKTTLAKLQEELQKANSTLMENLENIQDKVDELKEFYLDMIDQVNDKMEDQINQYERVNDLIDHNAKMVELIYGDKGYQSMNKWYALQDQNNRKELDSLMQQKQMWESLMAGQTEGSDAWKKYKENADKAIDQINSKLEDMVENLTKMFENKLLAAIDKVNNKMTSNRGMTYLDEEWDYMENYDDYFLDTVESKLGVDDVTRTYEKALADAAGNPKQYQKINGLMNDQLKILKEKDKLTQYDLDRAKAMLEVEQARMALEDARNNKTKMRLRRDSQGNYTYQYVADEEKLSDLEDSLAKAQSDLYNMDKEHYKENLNKITDTWKEFLQKNNQLAEEYAKAYAANDEEQMKRILERRQLLMQNYTDMMNGLNEDNKFNLGYIMQSAFKSLDIDVSKYTDTEKLQLARQIIPLTNSTAQLLNDNMVNAGGFGAAIADTVQSTWAAAEEHAAQINETLNAAGTSANTIMEVTDSMGNALDKNITNAEKLIQSNKDLMNSCMDSIKTIQNMLDWVDQYLEKNIDINKLVSLIQGSVDKDIQLSGGKLKTDKNIEIEDYNLDTTDRESIRKNTKDSVLHITEANQDGHYKTYLQDMMTSAFEANDITPATQREFNKQINDALNNIINGNYDFDTIKTTLNDLSSTEGLGNYLDKISSNAYDIVRNSSNASKFMEQMVNITANFPDTTDAEAIKQAFVNLMAIAAQKASS